ncbi:hypothetical protein [Faecalibacter rhinopitheci]|uniref:Uncharacterized protein n=1 Tax=Faecalibacter rhinopitheci TaxID=2779678 RepID=A0A8J7K5M5_9FLAO|nr:hypothetical protein [Faecalibacter rhinopitheci]MBF0598448.1 hypothetical protein [Faecalibacter rhinopitheci]
MKFSEKIIIIFVIHLSIFSFCQSVKLNKENVLKVFKSTIKQPNKKLIDTSSNPWFTDNTENKYYTSEFIEFKNARSFKRDYCKIINWNFHKNDAFILGDANYCSEPPTQKVSKAENYIEIKLSNEKDNLILQLFNQKKLIDKFRIIELQKVDSKYEKNEFDFILKLQRIK